MSSLVHFRASKTSKQAYNRLIKVSTSTMIDQDELWQFNITPKYFFETSVSFLGLFDNIFLLKCIEKLKKENLKEKFPYFFQKFSFPRRQ